MKEKNTNKGFWNNIRKKIFEKREKEKKESSSEGKYYLTRKTRTFIIFFIALGISSFVFFRKNSIVLSVISFVSFILFIILYKILRKNLRESARVKKIENSFPDFLQLVSSNLRAGMTIDRALILSAREEFSPLDKEIKSVGKDLITGKELSVSLIEMADRIKSEKVRRTVELIIRGLRSGGNLSILLEQISSNMREKDFIEKKASSSVLMYVIFIFFAVAVGAPVLFGLSSIMVDVLTGLVSSLPETGASVETAFNLGESNISIDFIIYFALIFMLTTNILASLILGLVNKGQEKEGLKYIIPLTLISFSIFFLIRAFLSGFFEGFFG